MQFSDTTDNQGIIQSCESTVFGNESYGAISDNTDRLQTFTRLANRALDNIAIAIMESDGRWEWDDTNRSDYPIATTDYVDGQQDYQLSTSHLRLVRVEGKDGEGDYRVIHPLDQSDIKGEALDEFLEEDGIPRFYDIKNNAFFLYPAPSSNDVDTTNGNNGLKIYFQREPDYFSTSDTTKEPGIPIVFHELIPMWASQKYLFNNDQYDKANIIRQEILDKQEQKLKTFFDRRNEDEQTRIVPKDNRTGRFSAR